MATARILEVDAVTYHNDPCAEISLSASIAKLLVERSPMHAWSTHPRLGGHKHEQTDAMDRGTLHHRLVLGAGADIFEIHADSYRTNAAKKLRDAAKAAGKIPVLSEVLNEARSTATAIRERLASFGVRLSGCSELAVEWREPVFLTDQTVQCRAMFDHAILEAGLAYDLKIVDNAHPDACVRAMIKYGYHIQRAAYLSALRALNPGLSGTEDLVFLFAEAEPPYAVLPVKPDAQFSALGDALWRRAVERWNKCRQTNHWPAYSAGPMVVSAPQWALAKALEQGIDVT